MTTEEEERVRQIIREEVDQFIDKAVFNKNIQILNARNIQLGRGTGTKIGTGSDQALTFNCKIGFFDTAPTVQYPYAIGEATTTAATQTNPWGYSSQAQAEAMFTIQNQIRAALLEKGLIKST